MSRTLLLSPPSYAKPFQQATLPRVICLALLTYAGLSSTAQADEPAPTQQLQTQHYDIAPGTLDQVLNQFAAKTGLLLAIDGQLTRDITEHPGLQGEYSTQTGLSAILVRTGLRAVQKADSSYVLAIASPVTLDMTELPDVEVVGRQVVQPRAARIVTRKEIDRSKGSSNSDIFSTITGVQANNIRNEAGALDIGIRGLQGEGRVPIFIDGSLQSTHTNRGYQGISDRTYIDTDLISTAALEKGASATATPFGTGAIGGMVNISTLSAEDILKKEEGFGALVKLKTYNNNKMPSASPDARRQVYYHLTNSAETEDFSNGAGTLAVAYKNEHLNSVLAYSKRSTGNYFAGRNGYDKYYTPRYSRFGQIISYRPPVVDPGQEVVNTSFESESILAKTAIRFNDEHKLELNYRTHQQEAGEVLAAYWYKDEYDYGFVRPPAGVEIMPQWEPGYADVDTYRGLYSYTPTNNDLINLTFELWQTEAELGQYNALMSSYGPNALQYLHHYSNTRTGFSVHNTSNFLINASVPVRLAYGLSRQTEEIAPSGHPKERRYIRAKGKPVYTSRDGERTEYSAFINANIDLAPVDIGLSLNRHKAEVKDYQFADVRDYGAETDFAAEIGYQALDSLRLYAKYSKVYRLPSLFEATTSGEVISYLPEFPLSPEYTDSYEIGFETNWRGVISSSDALKLSVNYFDSEVKDYIASATVPDSRYPTLYPDLFAFTNINYDSYRLTGFETDVSYDGQFFYAGASYTRYQDVEMCSRFLAQLQGGEVCTDIGFSGSLTPIRIPPKEHLVVNLGKRFLHDRLDIGLFYKSYSAKQHPQGFLANTGISALSKIPSGYQIDLYGEYRLNDSLSFSATTTNLTNRYNVSPGAIITMPEPGRTITLGMEIKI